MSEVVIPIITGLLTLIGVCVTAWASAKETRDDVAAKLQLAQAVTDTKLDELTREVREHNNFARRLPVLEQRVDSLEKHLND